MTIASEIYSEPHNAPATLNDLFGWRTTNQPDRLAYIYLTDGDGAELSFSYSELNQRVKAIAAWLQAMDVVGQRALLLYPPGLDYIAAFWGCLHAGVIAVPASPPRLNRNLLRLQTIASDAEATLALTTGHLLDKADALLAHAPDLKALNWQTTDNLAPELVQQWRPVQVERETLAYLQYTSGSTATPKGVMVSHANVLHNSTAIAHGFEHSAQSISLSWLPHFHDMGLIDGIIQPLYSGFCGILMSPASFLQQPLRWLRAISKYKVTHSGGPNFAYDLCVHKIRPEQRATLNLGSWSVAYNGAEPVRRETLERFITAFEPCGFRRNAFYPAYGLAEATLKVSGGRKQAPPNYCKLQAGALEQHRVEEVSASEQDTRTVVGSGQAALGTKIIIVEPQSRTRCAPQEVGEIWVAGPGVAQGYWNRPEESERTFQAHLADTLEGPYLRTGDLGFLQEGELFVTGRHKDLIIIRGRNHYPQDIERTAEQSHAALRPGAGAAFALGIDGEEERLILVHEVDQRRHPDFDEIIESIRRAVAEEHELTAHAVLLLKSGSISKTSSGKIQRHVCRERFQNGSLSEVARWQAGNSSVEENQTIPVDTIPLTRSAQDIAAWLQSQLASSLGLHAALIDIDRPLSSYGLDSLLALELTHRIETTLGVSLPLVSFLQSQSIRQLAAQALDRLSAGSTHQKVTPFSACPLEYPLSSGQQALWFLNRLSPESTAYNIARAVRIKSALDVPAFRRAFQLLLERHASLRTFFHSRDSKPFQRVQQQVAYDLEEEDAAGWSESYLHEQLAEKAYTRFDLEQGPLLRINLFKRSTDEYVLLLVVHHIITDFWSLALFMHELCELYAAFKDGLPAQTKSFRAQYADFVRWQDELLRGVDGERLRRYWHRQLTGELPALDLPTDRPRPPVQTYRGASLPFKLDAGLVRKLKTLARGQGATLYMALLAAFSVLLHRYTGQAEVLVGSPTTGRSHAEFAEIIGYFVNPVVLRADFAGDLSFVELLNQMRQTVLDAFEHQDYPFAKLVEELQPARDLSRSPLFQVMFILQKAHLQDDAGLSSFALGEAGARIQLCHLELESMALEQRVAQFDLTLAIAESGDGMAASMEYNVGLFDAATIERLAGHLRTLLEEIVAAPMCRVSELPLLDEAERQRVLSEWNQTRAEFPGKLCLHELIEEQVERSPERVAVIFEREQLSYAELNRRANQLAHYLRKLGVGPEVRVGLCLERSLEMVIALLGILKAGGAYVPLDPEYPRERLDFMAEDAHLSILLTMHRAADDLSSQSATLVQLDTDWPAIASESETNTQSGTMPENVAYVIYTSGSTGQPKGAMNTHRAICNRLHWMQQAYNLTEADSVLQKTPFSFDVSVWEFFWPLMTGARLVVAEPGAHRDGASLVRLINERHITVIHFVPAMLQVWLNQPALEGCISLRSVICSGEALPFELQERFFARLPAELHNLYGPTEAAIDVTFWKCRRESKRRTVPIGHAIANTQIYLLDQRLQPVPIGVPGELHIGGVGLARGYLHRPDLTAEKFIPHPFSASAGERLYRTGDLARYLPDGSIEFLRRLDHQVKIRGFRIELGEIEAVLCRHESVRDAVVVAGDNALGERQLVAYVIHTPGLSPSVSELRAFVKEKLPAYMIPALFVNLKALPLTSNGKVDRRALPAPEHAGAESKPAFVMARTMIEEVLSGIWSRLLGRERIGINDNFFETGGHSLLAMQLISRVREALEVELTLRALFEAPTIAALAPKIEASMLNEQSWPTPPLKRVSRDADLPLSFAQQRLWFLDQLEPDGAFYNIPVAMRLTGDLNIAALKSSLKEVIRRHEILRTNFTARDGRPFQVISPEHSLKLPLEDLSQLVEAEREAAARERIEQESRRPFDLAQDPLICFSLLRLGEREHIFLLTMHHIISDGWSLDVLFREVSLLYTALSQDAPSPLAMPPVQYADFAVWQRERLSGSALEAQLAFWKEQLANAPSFLPLPTDYARPPVQSYCGATQSITLAESLTAKLRAMSRAEGVTLYMTLLAAFQTLLHRYTGQDDIVVGTPVANRQRSELEGMIGLFVNTLALRADLSGDLSFQELLHRVRETTLSAYAHQDLPFEKLVEELQPVRDLSRTPLFQVMFAFQRSPLQRVDFSGLEICLLEQGDAVAKFDLTLSIDETEHNLRATLEYNTDLFHGQTVARMLGHFETLLQHIAVEPEQRLSRLSLLTGPERRQLLAEWNGTRTAYPDQACLHHLFERQAERTPEAVAVVGEDEQLTYEELNRRANQLARYLRESGVGPEVRVALFVEHSLEMVLGLLGILKAGGAYVPLDSTYPQKRLDFMLEEAQVKLLLTTSRLATQRPGRHVRVVCLDEEWNEIARRDEHNMVSDVMTDNLAYVIYTSGSTGKPKGVLITHRSVVNHSTAIARRFDLQSSDRVLQFAPMNFDVAAEELFPTLSSGAAVVLLPDYARSSLIDFTNFLTRRGLTVLNLPTSYWHQWVFELSRFHINPPAALRLMVVGSEKVLTEQFNAWRKLAGERVRWLNAYGLTETTITSTVYESTEVSENLTIGSMPIGQPIANTEAYVLDQHLEPVPIGVAGELYLGGECLARGYLDDSALTAERFIPHPFSHATGARLYRTGDVVRYLPNGNLEFSGRLDSQVKVRGFRIETGEIEAALATHDSLREALVIVREDTPGTKRLVAYVLADREHLPTTGELRRHLKERLPEYMIPSAFVPLDEVPLTPNGKVDHQALSALEQARPGSESDFIAPHTDLEKLLALIWSSVLGVQQIGIYDNFFELGGDSILSIQIVARANQAGLSLTAKELFQHQTIAGLASVAKIDHQMPDAEQCIVQGPVPLTPIQRWFFEQNLSDVHQYNQAVMLQTKQGLDSSHLERALQSLVEHHDALRLRFFQAEKGWQQFNAAQESERVFTCVDISKLVDEERESALKTVTANLEASLNIERGPLVRATFFDVGASKPGRLLIVVHHLAIDGVSWRVLIEDLQTACEQLIIGKEITLPPKTTSFKTWATHLQEHARTAEWQPELDYWLACCPTEISALPVDYPHGLNTEATARTVFMMLSAEETWEMLHEASAAYHTQITDLLLAALAQAFARWTTQSTVLIDVEGHGRESLDESLDISRTVGWFTTIYPVRLELKEGEDAGDGLKRVKEEVRGIPRRGIGYGLLRYLSGGEIREQLDGRARAEVSFNYLGQFDQTLGNLELFGSVQEEAESARSGCNLRSHLLDIKAYVHKGRLQVEWVYSEAVHERTRIEALAGEFMAALRRLIAHCLSPEAGGFTPSDFPEAELSQGDLDDLIAGLG
jgi:amino acid adenylation domain-containing protein/non-ribosomal peptide synthase protein (TIGR01720 family)